MKPHVTMKHTVEGRYDAWAVKCDSEGNEISRRCLALDEKNLITNGGMNRFAAVGLDTWFAALYVGTGSTAPANTDTALVAQVSGVTGAASTHGWLDTDTFFYQKVFTWGIGAAAGVLAELGLREGLGAGNLNTRALFGGGSPATVTVLSDEQLIVTYRLLISTVSTDSTFGVTTDGTAYTLTMRPLALGVDNGHGNNNTFGIGVVYSQSNGIIGSVACHGVTSAIAATTATVCVGTRTNQSNGAGVVTFTNPAYVADNHWRDITILWGLGGANGANLGAMELNGCPFKYQIGFSPRVNKVNTKTMSITIRYTWARA